MATEAIPSYVDGLMPEKSWAFIQRKLDHDPEMYRLIFLVRYLSGDGNGDNSNILKAIMTEHRRKRIEEMGLEDYVR